MVPRDFDKIKEGDILVPSNEENTSQYGTKWNEYVKGKNLKLKVVQRVGNGVLTEWESDVSVDAPYYSLGQRMTFTERGCHLIDFAGANKETRQSNGPRMSADGCLINEDGTLVHPTGRFEFL